MGFVEYNMMAIVVLYVYFWYFNDDKAKIFCRGFSAIDNFYITFYRSDVSEHCDVGKHTGV